LAPINFATKSSNYQEVRQIEELEYGKSVLKCKIVMAQKHKMKNSE